jgi:PAS domain S-box-containing protein
MENELKESESRYKRLFENHHQIMILIDPDNGKIVAANPAACNFYGWSREILEKMSVFQLHTLSSDPNLKKILSDRYEQHTSFIFQHRRVDDSIRDVEIYSSPIQIKGRTLLYFLIHDITTRKQMEKALMAEKERLAVTLRSIADGVITTDIQGRIVMMNRVAEKMTGWTQEEALGKPLSEVFYIINEYTRQICQNPVEKVLKTQSIVETENHTLLISRTKHERIISDSGAPIHDTAHCMIGVVLVFRDITEKQKMLETMQRAEKLDSLGVLAGGIAHDFNNLLSAIFGYIDMARIQSSTDKTLGDYLDRALEANSRARDLTQQLLTFAKGGTLERSMIPLEPFLKKNVRFALSGSRVTYLFDIADQLDACEFDEHQMAQVIDNIVINAQQAMPYGGTIFVSAGNMEFNADSSSKGHQGRYCHISIRDNGPGIAKNLQKRIFDPFFSTKAKGSGLGLAICYSIIHQHDGFIEVQSEPGKGTTFHIYLPVSDKQGPEITPVRTSVPPVRHEGRGNILIMDDEDAIRDILSTMLTIMGYTATKVADGREALKILQEKDKQGERFDAAILDLTVPGGVGGMEAVTDIRKTHPDLPVFASSGYSEDPVMSQPSAYGFTDSLRKPYTTTELADLLNRHLTEKEDSIEHCLQM